MNYDTVAIFLRTSLATPIIYVRLCRRAIASGVRYSTHLSLQHNPLPTSPPLPSLLSLVSPAPRVAGAALGLHVVVLAPVRLAAACAFAARHVDFLGRAAATGPAAELVCAHLFGHLGGA